MKKIVQIILAVAIVGLAYVVYRQISIPLEFNKEVQHRSAAVIDRIKDIRTAERAYKQMYKVYTGSLDTLINFVQRDSMTYERAFGSADDSVAVARGLVKRESYKVAVIDTIFGQKKLTPAMVDSLRYVPYSNGQEYILEAGSLNVAETVVQVFECRAPYKMFLSDLNHQELVNLIDEKENTFHDYPGIKVGSMTSATNDAGNWE